MLVLGIETSCDETAFGLVRDGAPLHALMSSQVGIHALFGGVVPEIASREHYRVLGPLFDRFMAEAGVSIADLDAVAVARGPGLLGSLLVGVSFAKGLCLGGGLPLVGVNHLHAHLLAAGIGNPISFPAVGLLVSGGHTHLYYMRDPLHFELLGRTLDDAAGEAFDKAAKMLNLPYPGGRYLDAFSRGVVPDSRMFPRPYLDNDNLDFSFSGLKTAMAQHIARHPELRLPELAREEPDVLSGPGGHLPDGLKEVCAAFSHAVVETLCAKLSRALARLSTEKTPARSIVVAGGVACNSLLRTALEHMAERLGLPLFLPPPSLCTDNGLMIAHAGWWSAKAGIFHDLSMEAVPRGRAIPDDALYPAGL